MAIKAKNRAWVKWAAGGFAAGMLLLTFFSNTIRNRSLPQVSTQRVTSGTITPEVTGGGQTESAGLVPVKVPASGVVLEVLAKPGDTVQKGQALLTVELQDDGALSQLRAQLEGAESDYESALLQSGVSEGSSESAQLRQLKNNVTAAQEALEERERYEAARAALEQALTTAEAAFTQAQQGYDTTVGPAAEAVAAAERDLEDATALQANAQANETYYKGVYDADQTEENRLLWEEKAAALEQANRRLLDGQNALFAAQQTLTALEREYLPALTEAQDTLIEKQEALAELDAQNAGLPDYLSCENALLSAQAALADFYDRLSADKVSRQLEDKALKDREKEIIRLKEEIQKLEDALGRKEIPAPCAGILRDFSWNREDSFVSGQELGAIDASAEEYTVRFPVSLEESRLVQLGAEARIVNHEGLQAQVLLKQIAPNETDPAGCRDLVFSVTGQDVGAGMYLNLSLSMNSAKYNTVVPNSALYQDSLGTFIYVVESTSSAAGSRSRVCRVNVEVLDSDSRFTAVRGDLTDRSFVVTLSSGPLEDGQSVRLGN